MLPIQWTLLANVMIGLFLSFTLSSWTFALGWALATLTSAIALIPNSIEEYERKKNNEAS